MSRLLVTLLAVLSVAALEAAPSSAFTTCGRYEDRRGDTIVVTKQGPVRCKTANRVVRDFRVLGRPWKQHGDGSLADTTYTSRRWPGWTCHEGGAAGACTRGKRVAAYEVRIR